MIVSRHLLVLVLVTTIGAPAFADELSKEACVDERRCADGGDENEY